MYVSTLNILNLCKFARARASRRETILRNVGCERGCLFRRLQRHNAIKQVLIRMTSLSLLQADMLSVV